MRRSNAFLVKFLLVSLAMSSAATAQVISWQKQASARLKAIYEEHEFRPREINPDWLADSSGYRLRETDPTSDQTVVAQYDVRTGSRHVVEPQSPEGNCSPDGQWIAEAKKRILSIRNVKTGERIPLIENVDNREISYGKLRWSPSSRFLSFEQRDVTDVRQRSVLVPDDPSYPGVKQLRFARVGETIASLRVGVANVGQTAASNSDAFNSTIHWLPLEAPSEGWYLGQVDWVPGSDDRLVETLSRFRDKREFWIAPVNGEPHRIYSEFNDAWAVGSHQINSGATWVNNGDAFIFISEKDGWRHAWLLSRDGVSETLLTPGEFDLIDQVHVDEREGWYYFYASPDNATQKYLYRAALDASGSPERLTPIDQPGTHEYDISPDAQWAIHTYSTINSPPVVDLVELPSHRVVRVVEDNAELKTGFAQLASAPTEFVQVDIGDGVVMDASLTKPRDFDPTKKYPVFVYVYGEPYLQTVLDKWGAAQIDFLRVVADAGYVVVSIDNRGTAAPKGAAWRRSIFGSLGPLSTEEQAAGLQKLAEMKRYLDLDRVGIWGWSGGGSNTLNAMFRKPDLYHVGIAVVPKPQPWLYNAWFQEIYMRTREVNADGYAQSAPVNFAEGLKGKLLIVTGSGETNTHMQIIEGLVDRLIELGKPFDYMVYPNRDHGLSEGSGTVVHVRMLILRYLIENLAPGPR